MRPEIVQAVPDQWVTFIARAILDYAGYRVTTAPSATKGSTILYVVPDNPYSLTATRGFVKGLEYMLKRGAKVP